MAIPTVPSASPLTEADFRAFRLAEQRLRAIKRAALIATISSVSVLGCTTISAAITVFFVGFWSITITVALAASGIVEFRGQKKLLRLDPAVCRTLALNQLALLAVVAVYCICQMITPSAGINSASLPAGFGQLLDPETMREIQSEERLVSFAFYVILILVSVLYFGAFARYYYRCRLKVEAFVRETPDWARRQLLELDR